MRVDVHRKALRSSLIDAAKGFQRVRRPSSVAVAAARACFSWGGGGGLQSGERTRSVPRGLLHVSGRRAGGGRRRRTLVSRPELATPTARQIVANSAGLARGKRAEVDERDGAGAAR